MVCIAVLPFENLSDNREHNYFSRGFVEDLITDLSHFPSLQVISSYSSRKIGAKTQNELAVARELAIDYLLTRGTKRRLHATWKYSKKPFKKRSLPAANHKPTRS